jgi:enterobactin synthetase component D
LAYGDFGSLAFEGREYEPQAQCALSVPHRLPSGARGYAVSIQALAMQTDPLLFPALPKALRHCTRSRQLSFVAGRLCAMEALRQLGISQFDVVSGDSGEPLWPSGVVGAITHSVDFACAAVTMRVPGTLGLGIDSEKIVDDVALRDIAAVCLTDSERAQLHNANNAELRATVAFSLKESFYKAIHPMVRRFVDYQELEVDEIDLKHGCAMLRPRLPDWHPCRALVGLFAVRDGHVHSSVLIQ